MPSRPLRLITMLRCLAFLSLLAGLSASATPIRIAIVGTPRDHTGTADLLSAAAPLAPEVQVTVYSPGKGGSALNAATDLGAFDAVFVDGATPGLDQNAAQFAAAVARTRVAVIRPTATLVGNVPLAEHPWLDSYWANGSQDNYAALVRYLAVRIAGRTLADGRAPLAPIVYPSEAFYHPDAPGLFTSWDEYIAWYRTAKVHAFDPEKLTVAIAFVQPLYRRKNFAHITAMVRAVERRGHNAVCLVSAGGPDLDQLIAPDGRPRVDVVITNSERLHLNDYQAGLARARRLGLTILSAINHARFDEAAFDASPTGLHPERTQNLINNERDGVVEPILLARRRRRG